MPECEVCREDVPKRYTCSSCGIHFCGDCGSTSNGLCMDCQAEDWGYEYGSKTA